jgi:hypothetical protein
MVNWAQHGIAPHGGLLAASGIKNYISKLLVLIQLRHHGGAGRAGARKKEFS